MFVLGRICADTKSGNESRLQFLRIVVWLSTSHFLHTRFHRDCLYPTTYHLPPPPTRHTPSAAEPRYSGNEPGFRDPEARWDRLPSRRCKAGRCDGGSGPRTASRDARRPRCGER